MEELLYFAFALRVEAAAIYDVIKASLKIVVIKMRAKVKILQSDN
ncbi:MAG: hypothetical protein WBJ17_04970 [Natronincolaceae bacterium]